MRIVPALTATFLALLCASCQQPTATSAPSSLAGLSKDAMAPGVLAHVSVGSNDLCRAEGLKPGCAADFSLVATEYADGTVKGEWSDQSGHGNGGVHVTVNCLDATYYVLPQESWPIAWVSGVVTESTNADMPVGTGVITVALDRSHNTPSDRFQDLASFTIPMSSLSGVTSCKDEPNLPVFLGKEFTGQVTIWER